MLERSGIVKHYFADSMENLRYYFPRPRLPFHPRPRLPERKRMTIAIGLLGNHGVVLAADTQETITGYTKENVGKVPISIFDNLTAVFAGAGDSDYIESAMEKAREKLGDCKDLKEVKEYLEERLVGYFDGYLANWAMFPQNERPTVEMLIGIAMKDGDCGLFHFRGTSFYSVDRKAIGTGIILANDLLSEYCLDIQDLSQLTSLAVFCMKKVKDRVDGCGGGTDIVVLKQGGDLAMLSRGEVERLEKKTLRLEGKLVQFDDRAIQIITNTGERADGVED
jgi:20S proteasome alpha/beta subunit